MTAPADPYAALRTDLTGQPPLAETPFPPGHPDGPPSLAPAPPGMVWTMLPNGTQHLVYLPPGYEKTPDTTPAAAPAERDKWPARMLSGGGATAAVIGVVGHYGQGLNQAGHGFEAFGIGLAVAVGVTGGAVMLIKGSLGSKRGAQVDVHLTVNNTVHGGNATSRSRSRG